MQYLTAILIFLSVYSVCSQSDMELTLLAEMDPDYGTTWIFFPDGDGNTQIAYLVYPNKTSNMKDGMNIMMDDPKIYYYLYRKNSINDPVVFKMSDGSYHSVLEKPNNYDPSKDTKIVIHGWKNTYKSQVGQSIKDSYLSQDDYNVIVVDWSSMADDSFYVRSASSTRTVGKTTSSLVDYLVQERGTDINKVHVIGHSLGAQTAGFTGMNTKSGKLGRITGLDPAKPLFMDKEPNSRLDPTDAQFVDVIHTCSGVLGSDESLGTADFWPNGGSMNQPGCSMEFAGACSHGRSYEYFAESIKKDNKPFQAYPCDSFANFKRGRCLTNPTFMGDNTSNKAKGSYYLMTRSKTPYALIW